MTYDLQAAAFRQAAQPRTVTDQRRAQYTNEAVLSATPAQLVTMLYDRLLLDLHRAEAAQTGSDWEAAREQLLHAQAIVGELSSTLRIDAWDGGEGLLVGDAPELGTGTREPPERGVVAVSIHGREEQLDECALREVGSVDDLRRHRFS